MTDRINHATEARHLLQSAAKYRRDGFQHIASTLAQEAQTEATLALVEQQRIANLIRLHAECGHTGMALFVPVGSVSEAIHPDVAAALGIEVTPDD
ncbi:hypothetical protein EDD28_0034 [Salana multivorans]|uniref:Uncharacterized protein n=1 Tax=Salana multivorans TaxID=120377 RepID=A0A3N2D6S0_9MICO|nr:hypothetical protein [Salana multivorans]ROR95481.1 hypothetical protein EDD28_0034 [Salana multivorans]